MRKIISIKLLQNYYFKILTRLSSHSRGEINFLYESGLKHAVSRLAGNFPFI